MGSPEKQLDCRRSASLRREYADTWFWYLGSVDPAELESRNVQRRQGAAYQDRLSQDQTAHQSEYGTDRYNGKYAGDSTLDRGAVYDYHEDQRRSQSQNDITDDEYSLT